METIRNTSEPLEILKAKASYLILGGLGFVGKNLIEYIIDADCYEKLVIVDKKLLKLNSYIPKANLEKFNNERIKVLQKDISKESDVRPIFEEHGPFDYVVNLAAEIRYDVGEESHKRNTLLVANTCGTLSAEYKVKKFIQLSTAYVYTSSSKPLKEDTKLEPQKTQAKYSLAAERAIFRIPDLNFVILRPAIIYGQYDIAGYLIVNTAISILYRMNNEKMRMLWDNDRKINIVHVNDVVRAIMYSLDKAEKGDVFNLSNADNMTQEKFFQFLRKSLKADVECVGTFKTHLVKIRFDSVIAEINDRHLRWWFSACQKYDIKNSPMNVMVYREQLEKYDLCIDGNAIKKLKFEYKYPNYTEKDLLDSLKFLIDQKFYPDVFSQ